jgi:hypothetical protein
MQTIGYWCDECRVKYVRHACKTNLPCGHTTGEAVFVYAKAFGRGGETVSLEWSDEWGEHQREVWVYRKEKDKTWYAGGAEEFWGFMAHVARHVDAGPRLNIDISDLHPFAVAEWLSELPEKVIRAYLERWQSRNESPNWRWIAQLTKADLDVRALAHSAR